MQIFNEDTHQYFTDEGVEIPSVTTILNYVTANHYHSINPSVLEHARMKGSAVHEACELIDLDCEPEEIFHEAIPYVKAYLDFKRDYRPKWEGIEEIVEGNGYCGTVDRYGFIGKKRVVVDIKTTSSPTKMNYVSLCCQTFAYAKAIDPYYFEWKRYGLFLKSDGDYRLFDCNEYEDKYDFWAGDVFDQCLELYHKLYNIECKKTR